MKQKLLIIYLIITLIISIAIGWYNYELSVTEVFVTYRYFYVPNYIVVFFVCLKLSKVSK